MASFFPGHGVVCRDGVANKSVTSWQQVGEMEFGKQHDTTDTTDLLPIHTCRLCCGLVYRLVTGELA